LINNPVPPLHFVNGMKGQLCCAAFGLPSELYLQSDRTGLDAAQTCKVLHALIRQRQKDLERGRDAHERLTRLTHDLKVSAAQREKLAQRLAHKERELGALENKVSWRTNSKACSSYHLCSSKASLSFMGHTC
jgi:septal ring factor EnvC (AmiA/AmiB activator)